MSTKAWDSGLLAIPAASENISGTLALRDANGNLSAGLTGNVTGNVTGNLTGNVTGDVTGNVTGSLSASTVLATGSTTPRYLAKRFSDEINVLDYGADPTGVADSWLAIQRAISAASNPTEWNPSPSTLTISDTILHAGKNIPKLFLGVGVKKVFIPSGTYRVSRPIVVTQGTHLEGEHGTRITPTSGSKNRFNLIEDIDAYIDRELCTDFVPLQGYSAFAHGLRLERLTLEGFHESDPYASEATQALAYYPLPLDSGKPGGTYNALANGTSGNNYIDLDNSFLALYPGAKLKIEGHSTVYTITANASANANRRYVTPNLTTTFANKHISLGLPASNGVMVHGGENSSIRHLLVSGFTGAGIFVCGGTPSNTVYNCMSNANDIGYWVEGGACTLIQPSGDANNTFIRSGWMNAVSATIISVKVEDSRSYDTGAFYYPYPFAQRRRATFEFGSYAGSGVNAFSIFGGTVNRAVGRFQSDPHGEDTEFISCFRDTALPLIRTSNFRAIGDGEVFCRIYQLYAGTNDDLIKRNSTIDYDGEFSYGTSPTFTWYDNQVHPPMSGVRLLSRHFPGEDNNRIYLAQLYVDQGSGFLANAATFTRTGTTATITCNAHTLQVGDYVGLKTFTSTTPANSSLTAANDTYLGYYTGSMRVMTVADANTFTVTVLNSGATAGTCRVMAFKYFALHRVNDNAHELQMPTMTGSGAHSLGYGWYDKKMSLQAGLRVNVEDEPEFWVKKKLSLGGTPTSPSAQIFSGSGAPTESVANGSIYLRTDGTASTTLYIRAADAWVALS